MKKLIPLIIILLFGFSLAFAVEIESCKSDSDNWECDPDEICVCEISGDCTDVYVYQE